MPLNLAHAASAGHAILTVTGDLDLATAPELAEAGHQLVQGGAPDVIIDAHGLDFCDSSGLRALIQIANELFATGGRLAMAGAGAAAAGAVVSKPAVAKPVDLKNKRRARYQANSAEVQEFYRVNRYPVR